MIVQRLKRFLVLVAVAPALGGCIYSDIREVDPDQSFQGLTQALQADGSTLNVVFVHGMGHHPFGEPELLDYQIRVAGALGFSEGVNEARVDWGGYCDADERAYAALDPAEDQRLKVRRQRGQAICPLKINEVVVGFLGWRRYHAPDSDRTLNMFELSWDRATELLQKTLLELDDGYHETVELGDDLNPVSGGRDREKDRVIVNRWLKKFVNQNLGDPAIYLGSYGDSIRRVVAEGLSRIAAAAGTSGQHEYAIVADSLGSRVVFDSLGCALDGPAGDRGCDYLQGELRIAGDGMRALSAMAGGTTQVFMNANQLPFLALASVRPPRENESERDWLKRFPCESGGPGLVRSLRKDKEGAKPLQIVAFTDPNDALSYHLTKRFRENCTHLDAGGERPVTFINVRISNVKWTFGIFANPDKAHSGGFRTNRAAIDLLVNGYRAQTP